MKLLASLTFFLLAVGAGAFALWLLTRAGQREHEEELMLRLRAMGGKAEEGAVPRSTRIRNPVVRVVSHWLWRSGAEAEPQTVTRGLLILVFLIPFTVLLFGWFAGLASVMVALTVTYILLARRAAARRALILSQLPGYLEAVIRILSAGNTLEESIAAAARESPEPVHTLFLSVGRQVRLGAAVDEVLADTADIHRLRDLKVLGLAAAINRKYGGSLRNILKSLMGAIRARDVAARELRALTAETRGSAYTLAGIVIAITAFIYIRNPGYYADMWASTGSRLLLIGSIVWQCLGMLVIWRMVNSVEDSSE